ncbi:MAG TPA: thiamine pyrophosphate-binding protein, partial [Hyphomicrobiaceae bacterium]|nr:thiamine pyrophosphate-binding protein [Hyphomicrobiaceae bacterium]
MTDAKSTRGADQLVSGLRAAGVDVIFSLSGNQIMPVYDALLDSGIRLIHTRHEGAAVYMAEAYAQVTGRVGVALLTAGPGFANGLSAAWSALSSETPILILSGDAPMNRDGHGAFQEMEQTALAKSAVKATYRAHSAATLGQDVLNAIAIAKAHRRGPVHIALPDDLLREDTKSGSGAKPSVQMPGDRLPSTLSDTCRDALVAALKSARQPIALAGPAFRRAATKPGLEAFTQRTGIPAIALESPRGLRDPRLGAFAEVLPKADLLITFGKPLDFMLGFGEASALAPECKIFQIDTDEAIMTVDRERLADRSIVSGFACPEQMLAVLTSAHDGHEIPAARREWCKSVLSAVAYRPPEWATMNQTSGRL